MLKQDEPLDKLFQALSDPGRRLLVDRLSKGPASVSELAKLLPMSLAAVVQHLQILESSGLVSSHKVGRVRTCRFEEDAMRRAEEWMNQRRSTWERRLDRLGDYLEEQEAQANSESKSPT